MHHSHLRARHRVMTFAALLLLASGGFGVAVAPASAAGLSCPATGQAICLYNSQNFNNITLVISPNPNVACTSHGDVFLTGSASNTTESVRNRTPCNIYLAFASGGSLKWAEKMVPQSEDGTITPLNAIDAICYRSTC